MPLRVSDILTQKISEIQSRVPVKMAVGQQSTPFQAFLDSALDSNNASLTSPTGSAVDKEGNDRSSDVERAKASRLSSNAFIPKDKTMLMQTINTNIQNSAVKYGVDESLIRAVIMQESGYDPTALSHSGAQGLMQLMPGTADALNVKDPWNISENIDGGTRYLRDQLVNFDGNISLALAAYNAGPYSVKKHNGIPPYTETQNYVKKVMQFYRQYSGNE